MRILYVEDEEEKAKEVMNHLKNNHDILLTKSYSSCVSAIYDNKYDLILLDMSLPLYDYDSDDNEENEFDTFAGIDIINELLRLERREKVVVITAYDYLGEDDNRVDISQLDTRMRNEYSEMYLGIIHYDASSLEWKRQLQEIIAKHEDISSR